MAEMAAYLEDLPPYPVVNDPDRESRGEVSLENDTQGEYLQF